MSFRFAVFAREGRGGGAVPAAMGELLAAKGSVSRVVLGELCLRTGCGLCTELRALGDEVVGDEILEDVVAGDRGGGGACLEGTNGS